MPAKYHPMKAVAAAIGNAIPFVILPVAFIRILPSYVPVELPPAIATYLQSLEATIISVGALVVVLAAMTAFFAKGLVWRAAFGFARQGTRVAWIYFVLSGGLISMTLPLFDLVSISFFLDFQLLLYILYAAIMLMAVYLVAEFFVYRPAFREDEYLDEHYWAA